MILIADSGSTKTDWVLMNSKDGVYYKTIGYNPYFTDSEKIQSSLSNELLPHLEAVSIKKVFFYGAGCSRAENIFIVKSALSKCFINSELFIGHDLLAAARALLGNKRGFAAIIGTGSNTCVYNGKEIEQNIDSLGYLLGDEGSGSNIGKKIVRDFLRGYLPSELQNKFSETYHTHAAEIFDTLYNQPLPNRFLAGFCKFAHENKDHGYIQNIVRASFHDFFENLVSRYPEYGKYKFNCVGSVGFIFSDILCAVSEGYKMDVGKIIHDPIEHLVQYHSRDMKK